MSENGVQRNCEAILREALVEVTERKERLQPFVQELAECDAAIKTLEKALAVPRTQRVSGPTQRERILAVLRESFDRLAAGQIADQAGIPRNSVYTLLGKLKEAGEIDVEMGKYGIPAPAAGEMEPFAGDRAE
jgi:sugar-specific transcriptional regulator TrmB